MPNHSDRNWDRGHGRDSGGQDLDAFLDCWSDPDIGAGRIETRIGEVLARAREVRPDPPPSSVFPAAAGLVRGTGSFFPGLVAWLLSHSGSRQVALAVCLLAIGTSAGYVAGAKSEAAPPLLVGGQIVPGKLSDHLAEGKTWDDLCRFRE